MITIDYCNERVTRFSKLSLHSKGKITACMFGKTWRWVNNDRMFISGRTIPSTSSFFLPPKQCNEYINNCWDCSLWRTNSKMFRLRHHHLPCFLTSLVPNPPVTTLSWPGTQRGEAQIHRDIYETERSVISCQPPLVPLKKQEKGSTFLQGDNSQAHWMTLKGTTTHDNSFVHTETRKQWFYAIKYALLEQIYI